MDSTPYPLRPKPATLGLLIVLAAGLLLSFSFPGIRPIEIGLDPSWQLALNEIANGTYRFGEHLAFTYGPLGYLLVPLAGFGTIKAGLAFALVVHVAVWLLIIEAWSRWGTTAGILFFTSMIVIARCVGWGDLESQILFLQLLLGTSAVLEGDRKRATAKLTALAALAGPLALVKFTLLLSSLGIIACAVAASVLRFGNQRRGASLLALGALVISLGLSLWNAFGSWGSVSTWFWASAQIAGGFSGAMSTRGPTSQVLGALVIGISVACLGLVGLIRRSTLAVPVFIGAPVLFLAFKHGFVRQDIHVLTFFPLVIVFASAVGLYTRDRRELIGTWAVAGMALIVWLHVVQTDPEDITFSEWTWNTLTAKDPRKASSFLLDPAARERAERRAHEKSLTNLASDSLPSEWLARLKGALVRVAPWELALCRANGLTCVYPRTLQIYSAYTAGLDRWTADGYTGAGSPNFLLMSFESIDGRHPWFGAPATWLAILRNYELVSTQVERNLFLLKQRQHPASDGKITQRTELYQDAQGWYTFAKPAPLSLVAIDFVPTLRERMKRLLFRGSRVAVEVDLYDGRRTEYRILPDTASAGLIVSDLPGSPRELLASYHGDEAWVRRLRITDGHNAYKIRRISMVTGATDTILATDPSPGTSSNSMREPSRSMVSVKGYIANVHAADARTRSVGSDLAVSVKEGETVTISGWAMEEPATDAGGAVYLVVDDRNEIRATYGLDSEEVQKFFASPTYAWRGYRGVVPVSFLSRGEHTIKVRVVNRERNTFGLLPQTVHVTVR